MIFLMLQESQNNQYEVLKYLSHKNVHIRFYIRFNTLNRKKNKNKILVVIHYLLIFNTKTLRKKICQNFYGCFAYH